jgi:hypothetical protein
MDWINHLLQQNKTQDTAAASEDAEFTGRHEKLHEMLLEFPSISPGKSTREES